MLATVKTLKRDMSYGPKVWLIVANCPFCSKTHNHGGGDDDLPFLGFRVADCYKGEYEMVLGPDTIVNDGTGPQRVGGSIEDWDQPDPGPRLNPRLSDLYDLWEASEAKRAQVTA